MIDLTLAEIADIVGGELSDITPEAAAATRVTGTVEFDSRAVTAGGLFLALFGNRLVRHPHTRYSRSGLSGRVSRASMAASTVVSPARTAATASQMGVSTPSLRVSSRTAGALS